MRALLVAPVALLVLAGCSATTALPQAEPVVSDAPPVASVDPREAAMESALAGEGIEVPFDGFVERYADIVCTGFGDGLPFLTLVRIGVEEMPRFAADEHAFLVGASVGAFCPEFSSRIGGVS